MAGNDKNKEQVIRLDDILYIIVKHHKMMYGLAVLGLLIGILISFAFYVKGLAQVEYYVTASIAVTSTNQDGLFSASSSDPNATDIHLAEDITNAVIYVCKSDTTLNAAAEKLQLIGVTADDIKPNLTLSQYESTQIIEMRLVWNNPEEGEMILNAITDVVPDILIDTLKIGDVTVVNPPRVKQSTMSFINVKIVAICFLLGAIVGIGIYLVKHFIHPTFLHAEDVKEAFDTDILGEIPGDKTYFGMKVNSFSANDYLTVQEYFSAVAHVLVYRLQDIDNVAVYITSSASQEGKSSITANVGYSLAKLGYKTLLMDLDLRNPSLASKFIFERDDKHTLNAVYHGDSDISEALVAINENLDLLPTKLDNKRMSIDYTMLEIISNAKTEYDFVIIDTAPVGQVSDSMSINQAADCAIFVVRQDQVWINAVTDSFNRLKKSGITILGAIINDTKDSSVSYYTNNYKQFGDSPYVHIPDRDKKKSRGRAVIGRVKSRINSYPGASRRYGHHSDEDEYHSSEETQSPNPSEDKELSETEILKKRIKQLEKENRKMQAQAEASSAKEASDDEVKSEEKSEVSAEANSEVSAEVNSEVNAEVRSVIESDEIEVAEVAETTEVSKVAEAAEVDKGSETDEVDVPEEDTEAEKVTEEVIEEAAEEVVEETSEETDDSSK